MVWKLQHKRIDKDLRLASRHVTRLSGHISTLLATSGDWLCILKNQQFQVGLLHVFYLKLLILFISILIVMSLCISRPWNWKSIRYCQLWHAAVRCIRGIRWPTWACVWLVSELSLKELDQFVSVNGCNSKVFPVKCGIPQGSILGQLLFLIYIYIYKWRRNSWGGLKLTTLDEKRAIGLARKR